MLGGTVGDALAELDKLLSGGKSPQVLAKDMVYYFRDLLIINTLGEASKNMIIASPTDLEMMRAQATNFNYSKIAKAIDLLSGVEADLRYSVQPRIVLETCIIRFFAQKSLEERVAELEKLLAGEARVQQNPQFRQNAAEHSKAVAVPNIPNTAPTQNLQNVAENSANYAQNAANLAQKQEKSESAKPTFGNAISENQKLLGELLGYLRDQKLMSLLMACRQIYKIAVDGAVARLFVKDASSVSVITSAKYKPILSEFMDNHGLKWEVVGLDGSGNVSELAGKLEGRLEIK
jgi:DNA polymerase III gamma/tau subunit